MLMIHVEINSSESWDMYMPTFKTNIWKGLDKNRCWISLMQTQVIDTEISLMQNWVMRTLEHDILTLKKYTWYVYVHYDEEMNMHRK